MEQCDDDMSEYFRFLEENWRSIVSASGTDNMSGSEAQDLVYRIFLARNEQKTSESRTKRSKSGGKLVGSFSLKNPFLEGIKTVNNDCKGGDDAVPQEESEKVGSGDIKNIADEVADKTTGSRKPRVQFRVPIKSNEGQSFDLARYPFCAKLMKNSSAGCEETTNMINNNGDLDLEIPLSETLPKNSPLQKTTDHQETLNHQEPSNTQETTNHQETAGHSEPVSEVHEASSHLETTNPKETTNHQETAGHSEPVSKVKYREDVLKRTKLFICNRCKKGYDQSKSFKNHVCFKKCTKIPCPSCSKMVSKTNMSHHMKLHSLVKFDCKQCKKSFRSETMLAKHTQEHKAKKKHVCDICGLTCERPNHLKLHKQTHETKNLSNLGVKCKFCEWNSDSMLKLKTHLVDRHIELAKKCSYCSKIYFSRRGMRDHLKIHKGECVNGDVSETIESVPGENGTIDTVPRESATIDSVPGESATMDSISGESGTKVDDTILENAIVYNFSIENIGTMEEVIADGIYSIGDVSLTSADILPFIANM